MIEALAMSGEDRGRIDGLVVGRFVIRTRVRVRLDIDGLPPLSVIHCLNQWRRSDHATSKMATVQTLHSLASSGDCVELDENLGGIGIGIDVNDFAELAIAFSSYVSNEVFLPLATGARLFSVMLLATEHVVPALIDVLS